MSMNVSAMNTRQSIIDAAISLFNSKGFTGTSVREIARKAKVNVAHISYYFNGKGGLLEYLVSEFYEGYIAAIEKNYSLLTAHSARERLQQMLLDILYYQHDNRQLARFVHREVTLDTILIREVMTTYLMKEKYYFTAILEEGMKRGEFRNASIPHIILQLRSLLHMPYLQSQYLSEVLYIQPHELFFVRQYYKEILNSLNSLLAKPLKVRKTILVR